MEEPKMKNEKSISAMFLVAAFAVLIPSVVLANPTATFCAKWSSQYNDSGVQEDSFTSTSTTAREAQYAYATVYRKSDGYVIWGTAPLNESGCTPVLTLAVNTEYRFRVRTIAQYSSTQRIFIQNDSATTWTTSGDDAYEIYDAFYTPTNQYGVYQYQATFGKHWETNMMPIAGKIWDRVENGEIMIPTSTIILVRKSSGYSYNGKVGSNYTVWCGDSSSYVRKFIAAHEIGHAVGHRKAEMHGSNYGATQPNALCSCNHIGGESHCLQSREYIRAAENEGWAHFFSSAVFNNRTAANGWFGYYKEINDNDGEYDCEDLPCPIDVTNDVRWMEHECSTGYTYRGVEWDWLTFFWGLWTEDATYKYTMTQITDVWDEVHDVDTDATEDEEWYWSDLVTAAYNIYSSSKADEFEDQGSYSGVDH
jgi:hypothetical protein